MKFQLKARKPQAHILDSANSRAEIIANSERMELLIELLAQLTGLGYELVYLQPTTGAR